MQRPPMPEPTTVTRPFWEGLRAHRVQLQQCRDCGRWVWYPRARCPHCAGGDLEWRTVSGAGVLYSYCITEVPTAPAFAEDLPQRLAIVELDEGVRLTTTLTRTDDAHPPAVGMRVLPHFDDSGAWTLLRFALVPDAANPERGSQQ